MKMFYAIVAVLVIALGSTQLWGRQLDQEIEFYLPDENQRILIADNAKPRFVGEIGGIYIVPDERLVEDLVPQSYVTHERLCGDSYSTTATFEEAGELDFDIDLPATYVLQLDDMNTGAVACNGIVYAARRAYEVDTLEGVAYVSIARSVFDYETLSFADDRFVVRQINGEQVVVAMPITEDGSVGIGYAWFPDVEGKISIQTSGLPRREFTDLVATVASSIIR